MSNLRKAQRGKPFAPHAESWNAFVDAARWAQAQQYSGGRGDPLKAWLRPVVCRMTEAAPGAGKYYGRIAYGPVIISASSDFAEGEVGRFPDFDDALLCNMQELDTTASSSGHELTDETNRVRFFVGLIVGSSEHHVSGKVLYAVEGNFIDFGCEGDDESGS
jgi:hypothetical protein